MEILSYYNLCNFECPFDTRKNIISGVIGAIGGIASGMLQNDSIDATNEMNRRFMLEQQEKQNEFNSKEAERARQYQKEMSSSEMSRRVGDMRSAGLNPAFAGQFGGAAVGAVPMASASAPVSSPNMKSHVPVIDPLTASQVALNMAEAKKAENEADKTEKETNWIDILNGESVDYTDSQISVNGSIRELNEAKKQEVAKHLDVMDSDIKEINKKVNLMDSEITLNDIDAFWKSGRYAAEIDALKAKMRLDDAEAKEILYLMFSKKQLNEAMTRSYNADPELKKAQRRYYNESAKEKFWLGRGAYYDAGDKKVKFELDKTYGEIERVMGIVSEGIGDIKDILELVLDFRSMGLRKMREDTRRSAVHETERHNRVTEDKWRSDWKTKDKENRMKYPRYGTLP